MIRIEGNGIKVEIPAGCENAAGLVSAVIAQLSGSGKFEENKTDGLISEQDAVRRERAAVEKARRKWKREAENHENHEKITRDESVILAEECVIECESELIINKNINKKNHSNKHSDTCGTQRSLAKRISRPRVCAAEPAGQYLMDFMYELPEEWQTEKVCEAWKVFVEEFTDFRRSSSRQKRQHTKEELLGILDILRFAYARQGEQGLLDTIWLAVETQRRYVWDLPNSCRNAHRQRPMTAAPFPPPEPEPEPEVSTEEQIETLRGQIELFRSLGSVDLRRSAEEKLRELEALNK